MQVVDCQDADLCWLPAPEKEQEQEGEGEGEYRLCPVAVGEKKKIWAHCIGYEPEYDNMAAWKAWVEMEERRREAEAQQQQQN